MRALLLLGLLSCDPVNKITVAFPVEAHSTVQAYWVKRYEGRTYVDMTLFNGEAPTGEFAVTKRECCGTAAAYRDDALWFIACVQRPAAAAELVCGRPGDPPAKLVRRPAPADCRSLEGSYSRATLDIDTCTLTLGAPSAPPRR